MSLGRPDNTTSRDPWRLFEFLCNVYDELTKLRDRVAAQNIVTVVFDAALTDKRVSHGLSGVSAWEVVDRDADAQVWKSATVNNERSTIILQSSAPVTVRIRFS